MFGVSRTLTQTVRQPCISTLVLASSKSVPITIRHDTLVAHAAPEKKKNIAAFKSLFKAYQCEFFGLPPENDFSPPPELADFQGFLFKNRQQLIRLEKDTIQRKQLELIKSS